MKDRIVQLNQIRGLLAEYGIVIPQSAERVRQQLPLFWRMLRMNSRR
ncbi:MAG TPA: hypothetical protein VES89_06615 [Candidatus Competibacteraceae bacterium]|nr:hypothetical protein [Candidatus Competibacteraceae bacterium]